ncbi:MAG: hypothetical protein HQK51_05260 [Oligoflexia bacterium]|nr:hypothetical protein [Oligoflexia bacterium]
MKEPSLSKTNNVNKKLLIIFATSFLFYFLLPSSFPFILNGIPLNKIAELVTLMLLGVSTLILFTIYYLKKINFFECNDDCLKNSGQRFLHSKFCKYYIMISVVLVVTLIITKLFFPVENNLRVCLTLPEIENSLKCVNSNEWFGFSNRNNRKNNTDNNTDTDNFTRFEEELTFHPNRPWRISILDTGLFGIYNSKEGSRGKVRENLRYNRASPFDATFTLSPFMINELKIIEKNSSSNEIQLLINYSGYFEILSSNGMVLASAEFKSEPSSRSWNIPINDMTSLKFHYRNYQCPTNSSIADCNKSLSMKSIPIHYSMVSVFIVEDKDGLSVTPLSLEWFLLKKDSPIRYYIFKTLKFAEQALLLFILIFLFISLINAFLIAFFNNNKRIISSLEKSRNFSFIVFITNSVLFVFSIGLYFYLVEIFINRTPRFPLHDISTFHIISIIPLFSLLVLFFEKVRNLFLAFFEKIKVPFIFLISILPIIYIIFLTTQQITAVNEIHWFNPGDDSITYAHAGKNILWNKVFITEISIAASKPLYPYLRAFFYYLLGDGDIYLSYFLNIIGASLVSILFTIVLISIARAASTTTSSSLKYFFSKFLLSISLVTTFVYFGKVWIFSIITRWTYFLFSEPPAWFFLILAFIYIIPLSTLPQNLLSNLRIQKISLVLIGTLLGFVLISRVNFITFFLTIFGIIIIVFYLFSWEYKHEKNSIKQFIRSLFQKTIYLIAPIILFSVILVSHLLLGGTIIKSVIQYLGYNTNINSSNSFFSLFTNYPNSIFPPPAEFSITIFTISICWSIYLLIYLIIVRFSKRDKNKTADVGLTKDNFNLYLIIWVIAVLAIYLGALVLQIPSLPAPYYPRTIIITYFLLAISNLIIGIKVLNLSRPKV